MSQLTSNADRDLFKILVTVAWIDGEIQAPERAFLEKIAAERNIELSSETEELLNNPQVTSTEQCYQLLREYMGSNPNSEDYHSLLSAVSSLIYSDNDIATEEADLLTQMQNLDPQNSSSNSTFDKLIVKIQKIYQKGLKQV